MANSTEKKDEEPIANGLGPQGTQHTNTNSDGIQAEVAAQKNIRPGISVSNGVHHNVSNDGKTGQKKDARISSVESPASRDLLDLIDTLRSNDVGQCVDLPQIVVCGDQSSGKSSVLEAISGQPFPSNDGVCTRFATELILRRGPEHKLIVTISPGPRRSENERREIHNFMDTVSPGSVSLVDIVEAAKKVLKVSDDDKGATIVRDILRIAITGPDQPHLTLVDLPGIFRSASSTQTLKASRRVKRLVHGYLKNERSVIMTVISAKNEYNNQEIIERAKLYPKWNERTFAVLTKPDTIESYDNEKLWAKYASNKEVVLNLGWHVLRNRNPTERGKSTQERDAIEKKFLSAEPWSSIEPTSRGIEMLRVRLSKILRDQIVLQLPDVVRDVRRELADAQAKLKRLGPIRQTTDQQRKHLLGISQKLSNLLTHSKSGNYGEASFLKGSYSDKGTNPRRLRAVIQNGSSSFTQRMKLHGHTWKILSDEEEDDGANDEAEEEDDDEGNNTVGGGDGNGHNQKRRKPKTIRRGEFAQDVQTMLEQGRGRELPGTYNQNIVTDLFHRQAESWADIVNDYVADMVSAAFRTLDLVVHEVADRETAAAILVHLESGKLALRQLVEREATSILNANTDCHPITYGDQFVNNLWDARRSAHENSLALALVPFISADGKTVHGDVHAIIEAITSPKEDPNLAGFASLQAIYTMEAYYEVARDSLVDDLAKLVIERVLLKNLDGLFDSTYVSGLDDATIESIAGESPASAAVRARLEHKIGVLQAGVKKLNSTEGIGSRPDLPTREPVVKPKASADLGDWSDISDSDESDEEAEDRSSNGDTRSSAKTQKQGSAPDIAVGGADDERQPSFPSARSPPSPAGATRSPLGSRNGRKTAASRTAPSVINNGSGSLFGSVLSNVNGYGRGAVADDQETEEEL